MKVVIFGAGRMYQKTKSTLRKDIEIAAFIDNDSSKWGYEMDGVQIFPPRQIHKLAYDFVFMLSSRQSEMREQLINIGVPAEKIAGTDQMERICESEGTKYYGDLPCTDGTGNIMVFSHALVSTGAQNVLYYGVRVLREHGYRIIVLSKQDGILRDRFLQLGASVVIMGNPHIDNEEYLRLVEWADAILVNTVWLYYAVEELLHKNKKIIWWIHETLGLEYLSNNLIQSMQKADRLSVYVVSPLIKRRLFSRYGRELRTEVLRFGLPANYAAPKSIVHRQKMVFAIIGAMGWIKGQDLFIQAATQLTGRYGEDAEFWIVGRGNLAENDAKNAERCKNIKIVGEIENEKMPELYSRIDVVVCCSREESMSVVVIEGCMNEKAVIVSDAAGIADFIVNGEEGLIFQNENIEQLAGLMKWVIDNPQKAEELGHNAKRVYEKYFNMETFENNLLDAFRSLGISDNREL